MLKIALYLLIISLFQACTYKSTIQSGEYYFTKNRFEESINPLPIAIKKLHIDAHTQQVTFMTDYSTIHSKAKPLEEEKWFKDCHTNTSYNVIEVWEFKEKKLKERLYLSASCDRNVILLFNPKEKDAYHKATIYKKQLQTPINEK
jgi:hypothetical protein